MYIQYEPSKLASGISITAVSINLNLFFLRIMKEHSIFLEAGFTPKDKDLAGKAEEFKNGFEDLLKTAISLGNGIVNARAMESQQFVTPYTAQSERITSYFTGIPIDSTLTVKQKNMTPGNGTAIPSSVDAKTKILNEDARRLTGKLADFKKKVLLDVLNCRVFTTNYPAELHHMRKEANLYLQMLDDLGKNKNIMNLSGLMAEEAFWNGIMAEHNKAAAGRLDPTEENAIEKSRMFAYEFDHLASRAKMVEHSSEPVPSLTGQSLEAAKQLQEFQIDTLKGIMDCKIQSILPALRVDHHVRETAFFIWLLVMGKKANY